jgi:hypothetical protein
MNGLTLYFASNRPGGFGAGDLYVTSRDSLDREWGRATNLGSVLPAGAMTLAPFITSNNRVLYFMSARPDSSSTSPCTPQTCFERLDL